MHVDAKVAADSIFTALGKPLPERAPPEEKVVPSAKGKKGKDVKKGTVAAALQRTACKTIKSPLHRTSSQN